MKNIQILHNKQVKGTEVSPNHSSYSQTIITNIASINTIQQEQTVKRFFND